MATSKLIQWVPEVIEATSDELLRYGPNAPQVMALMRAASKMKPVIEGTMTGPEKVLERNLDKILGPVYTRRAAIEEAYRDALPMIQGPRMQRIRGWQAPSYNLRPESLRLGLAAESASDILTPEQYKIGTRLMDFNRRVSDLQSRIPESEAFTLISNFNPRTVDDLSMLEEVYTDPRSAGIMEILAGLKGDIPLADRLAAARRLDRASRAGRRMQ